MFILRFSIQLLLIILSYIVPKNKKLFLIGSDNSNGFVGNTKYFYIYLINIKKSKIEYYWITQNKKLINELDKKKWPVVYKYSIKGIWYILRSNFLFINYSTKAISFSGTLIGRFNIVQFYHGTPLKKIDIN